MIGQSFAEEMDCGNFFDNMDDLMDFPTEDIGLGFGIGDDDDDMFPTIWSTQPESWPNSDPFSSNTTHSQDASTELYVPFENIVQLEQQQPSSGFADDSFSDKKADSPSGDSSFSHGQFRSSSPVSVLESSSSSSQTTPSAEPTILPGTKHGRPRTKRPRPAPADDKDSFFSSPISAAESRLVIRIPKHLLSDPHNNNNNNNNKNKHKKSTKKKAKEAAVAVAGSSVSSVSCSVVDNENQDSSSSEQAAVRKCMHCEVTKTPQWRLGPMGPKTLCNACGVRYKSGRLFPEYRPAASPTFTPALHSNSHKKVVEMRSTKRCFDGGETEDLIPNRNTHIAIDYV